MAQQPPMGQGLLIHEVSQSHSDTRHSVRLLWMSDRPVAETSSWQNKYIHKTKIHTTGGGFQSAVPASKLQLTHALEGGHWCRHSYKTRKYNVNSCVLCLTDTRQRKSTIILIQLKCTEGSKRDRTWNDTIKILHYVPVERRRKTLWNRVQPHRMSHKHKYRSRLLLRVK